MVEPAPATDRLGYYILAAIFGFLILYFVISSIGNSSETTSEIKANTPTQPKAAMPKWNEPDSFAGLEFGDDLTKQITACPSSWMGTGYKKQCYEKSVSDGWFELQNVVDLPGVFRIYAIQLNAKLAAISLSFRNREAAELLEVLRQKYGAPTKSSTNEWRSPLSATTSYEALWIGKRVSIIFKERIDEIHKGIVEYKTKEWIEARQAKNAEAIKKGIGGL